MNTKPIPYKDKPKIIKELRVTFECKDCKKRIIHHYNAHDRIRCYFCNSFDVNIENMIFGKFKVLKEDARNGSS